MAETQYKGRRVLERLVEELGVNAVIAGDEPLQIDYVLRILQTEDGHIEDKDSFCQRIGFTVNDPQIISFLKEHPLLMSKTKYQNKTVLQRLIEELEMYHFAEEYCMNYLS
eukprot:757632_1